MVTDKRWVIKNNKGYYSNWEGNDNECHPVFSKNPDEIILYDSLFDAQKDIKEINDLKDCSVEEVIIKYSLELPKTTHRPYKFEDEARLIGKSVIDKSTSYLALIIEDDPYHERVRVANFDKDDPWITYTNLFEGYSFNTISNNEDDQICGVKIKEE